MMASVLSRCRRWLLNKIVSTPRLSTLLVLRKRLRVPLRRDGMDPVAELTQLTRTEPFALLANVLGVRVWLASGYAEARAVLADTDRFTNDLRPLAGRAGADGAEAIGGLGFTDPPEHSRLRGYLTPAFTRRRLAALKPRIEEIVAEQLDLLAVAPKDIDLVRDFAFPVPFRVICELLGLSEMDRAAFAELGSARFDAAGGVAGALSASAAPRAFLIDVVARQRHDPQDGLIGMLVTAHGDELDDVELGGLVDGVFLGGYETSASMLALGALTLLRDRAAYVRLGERPDTVDAVVEELLRYLSVVQIAFPRFARQDMVLFGRHVSAGDLVACSLSGGNRDEALGEGADRFDPTAVRPAAHLTFGHGPHRCVGAELARMELQAAFRGLTRRFPDLRLAVRPSDLRFRPLSIVYGIESLPVRLEPPGEPDSSSARRHWRVGARR
jgi:cytochrome P450